MPRKKRTIYTFGPGVFCIGCHRPVEVVSSSQEPLWASHEQSLDHITGSNAQRMLRKGLLVANGLVSNDVFNAAGFPIEECESFLIRMQKGEHKVISQPWVAAWAVNAVRRGVSQPLLMRLVHASEEERAVLLTNWALSGRPPPHAARVNHLFDPYRPRLLDTPRPFSFCSVCDKEITDHAFVWIAHHGSVHTECRMHWPRYLQALEEGHRDVA